LLRLAAPVVAHKFPVLRSIEPSCLRTGHDVTVASILRCLASSAAHHNCLCTNSCCILLLRTKGNSDVSYVIPELTLLGGVLGSLLLEWVMLSIKFAFIGTSASAS
jgi:hypothetical protein